MIHWFRKNVLNLYMILLGLHCWFILMGLDQFRFYSKILLVPFLILMFLVKLPRSPENGIGLMVLPMLALICSFAGDLFLTFKEDRFFLLGMFSFMLTHIFNSIYFFSLNGIRIRRFNHGLLAIWITGTACVFELFYIKDNLGNYYMPVLVYSILLSVMVVSSSNLLEMPKYKRLASAYFIPGAILFFVSDGILALNKFSFDEPFLDIFVMLTYGLAQLLLVRGYYKTVRLKKRGYVHPHHDEVGTEFKKKTPVQ